MGKVAEAVREWEAEHGYSPTLHRESRASKRERAESRAYAMTLAHQDHREAKRRRCTRRKGWHRSSPETAQAPMHTGVDALAVLSAMFGMMAMRRQRTKGGAS